MPEWILKLARRLMALEPGRYQITVTIGHNGQHDLTITPLGKVEVLGKVEKQDYVS